jgi:hypothetical protein
VSARDHDVLQEMACDCCWRGLCDHCKARRREEDARQPDPLAPLLAILDRVHEVWPQFAGRSADARLAPAMRLHRIGWRADQPLERATELLEASREIDSPRDRVYRERNAIACALAVAVLAGGGRAGVTTDPAGEDGFHVVVVVILPAGRVGWHMDERDPGQPWLALPPFAEAWEVFTGAENAARLMHFVHLQREGAGGDGP